MGKTSRRRARIISRQHENIRYQLAYGKITFEQFEKRYKELKKENKL